MRAPKAKKQKKLKSNQKPEKKNIRDTIIDAVESFIVDNKQMTDKERATGAYDTIITLLSSFICHTKLECRILSETRALESAITKQGMGEDDFYITVFAKPKTISATNYTSNIKDKQSNESTSDTKAEDKIKPRG